MFGFSQKVIDPVCKMQVDKNSEYSQEYQGTKYYFCSPDCQKKFVAETEKYTTQKENVQSQGCC